MEKKQTAVEWFLNELQRMQYFIGNDMLQAYNQAIVMEKEQIVEAMKVAMMRRLGDVTPEDYYTQTYGK